MAAAVPTTIDLDASAFAPDVATIDALARLQLAARRAGRRLRLLQPPDELLELITLCGLGEVLGVEPRRQAEEREERLRLEEERDLGDPRV
jgi:ABC-type transporter Mla MlaB component